MDVDGFFLVFLLGFFGGVIVELYKWFQLRESPNFPAYSTSAFYWGLTVAMIVAGGILATLYGTDNVNAILAVNLGAAAPAIIRTLATTVPSVVTPQPPPEPGPEEGGPPPPPPAAPTPAPSALAFLSTR